MTQIKEADDCKLLAENAAALYLLDVEENKEEVRCSESCSLLNPLLLLAKFPPAT